MESRSRDSTKPVLSLVQTIAPLKNQEEERGEREREKRKKGVGKKLPLIENPGGMEVERYR